MTLYLLLGTYRAEIIEQKHILGLKHWNRTIQPCPRYNAITQHLKYSSTAKLPSSRETIQIINEHHKMHSAAENNVTVDILLRVA